MSTASAPHHPEPGQPTPKPRGIGQKISLVTAFLCYGGAFSCLVGLGVWVGDLGGNHPIIASLGASAVFFIGAGVVLHVMGLANLPSLRFDQDEDPPGA